MSDDDLTPEELADQMPIESVLEGGPHDGKLLHIPQVSIFFNHYRDGDLLLNAYYHATKPDPAGRPRYVFSRIEPAAVLYDEEPA